MNRTININRFPGKIAIPAIAALALALSGCAVDLSDTEPRDVVLTEAHGSVWVPADQVEYLQCNDGLLLVCDTPISRYSDRLCRCVR